MAEALAFDSLLEHCLGDRELALELLRIYRREAPGQILLIEAAIASGDGAEVFQKLHRLKGTLASICALESAALCGEQEKVATLGKVAVSLEALKAALARLDAEVSRLT